MTLVLRFCQRLRSNCLLITVYYTVLLHFVTVLRIHERHDLDTMIEWSNTWLLWLKAAKCHLLKIIRQRKYLSTKYNINGSQLQDVSHYPNLGNELSSDLTWKNQICNIQFTKSRGYSNVKLVALTKLMSCT